MWKKIKLILQSVREYKKYALITPLFMAIEAFFECLLPFIMQELVGSIQGGNITQASDMLNAVSENMHWSPVALIISLVVLAIGSMFAGIMGGVMGAKASVGLAANLRADYYKKIQSFSFSNIDKFSSSSLITRMTTDINNIQMSFQMCIRIVIRVPLLMIFSIIMSVITGGNMVFIFIGLIPLVAIGLIFIGKGAMKIFMRVFKRYDKLNESIQENIAGIRVVKNFVREDYEISKMAKATDDVKVDFKKAEIIVSFASPVMNLSVHIVNILVCGLGGWLVFDSSGKVLDVGQLSALLTYGVQILMSLLMVTIILAMLSMSLESMRRIAEVLREETTIRNPEDPIMKLNDGSVKFDRVTFKYSAKAKRNTLDEINLNIKSGQFIGIIGATGSGKTTQLPVILHEAGYSDRGIIAVTQPRRIAALSVSEFISKQLKTKYPGLVGYKFRFDDKTDSSTKIKIMTDGILLQEMKLDPYMSKYSVVMVDEAHERSLNIDFVLGLLKRVLAVRHLAHRRVDLRLTVKVLPLLLVLTALGNGLGLVMPPVAVDDVLRDLVVGGGRFLQLVERIDESGKHRLSSFQISILFPEICRVLHACLRAGEVAVIVRRGLDRLRIVDE